ncbi:MAG: metal ABC transporter permease [Thermodesulfobacteriota bacterium]|nr:metal ABC transporter permease [Thermodesulfobacteriota bacterium]
MTDLVELLAAPFAACILIAALHCYMGLHVVKRGVIFVDLALAQMAALGAAIALLLGPIFDIHPHNHENAHLLHHETEILGELRPDDDLFMANIDMGHHQTHASEGEKAVHDGGIMHRLKEKLSYILSLLFGFLGAAIFALGRFRDERVPHEAIIGIVFVVSSAVAVLVLSKAPHGHERMEAMLVGSILFVNWSDVLNMLLVYIFLGILHFRFRRVMMRISEDTKEAESAGIRVRRWDFLFYASFGLMVTQSVSIAGVLVVFSYLIIPSACAIMLVNSFLRRLIIAWGIALGASLSGLALSAWKDLPTGPSLVATFGAALIVCAAIRPFLAR